MTRRTNNTKETYVLTGMKYDVKKILYGQAKQSFKTFEREMCNSSNGLQGTPGMKLEPAFLVENEETFLTAGYVRSGR